jgi:hypothetical protein
MRRALLLVAMMAVSLLLASGVALAVTKIGTDGPDTLSTPNITAERSANRSSRIRDRGTPDGCPHAARSVPSGA